MTEVQQGFTIFGVMAVALAFILNCIASEQKAPLLASLFGAGSCACFTALILNFIH